MRLRIENLTVFWLVVIFIVLPAFIASIRVHDLAWEVRFAVWLATSCVLAMIFQFYIMQGGSNHGYQIMYF